MSDVVRLNQHAIVGKPGELGEHAFGMACRFWISVEGEFFAARREAHAKVFFDQLEVPVVVTEQNGGVGAFSQFEFTHEGRSPSLLYDASVILAKPRERDKFPFRKRSAHLPPADRPRQPGVLE